MPASVESVSESLDHPDEDGDRNPGMITRVVPRDSVPNVLELTREGSRLPPAVAVPNVPELTREGSRLPPAVAVPIVLELSPSPAVAVPSATWAAFLSLLLFQQYAAPLAPPSAARPVSFIWFIRGRESLLSDTVST